MGKRINLQMGTRFGKLVVIGEAPIIRNKNGSVVRLIICLCDCGIKKNVRLLHLRHGGVASCGCHQREANKKHGLYNSPEYRAWQQMKDRCLNSNNASYKGYGGRGISICEEWKSFESFYKDMGKRPVGMSLDRIDNNGDYCKENCRWASNSQQMNNRRNTFRISYEGQEKTWSEWSIEKGINRETLRGRYNRGFDLSRVFAKVCRK